MHTQFVSTLSLVHTAFGDLQSNTHCHFFLSPFSLSPPSLPPFRFVPFLSFSHTTSFSLPFFTPSLPHVNPPLPPPLSLLPPLPPPPPPPQVRIIPVQLQMLFARLLMLDQQSCRVDGLISSFGWTNNEVSKAANSATNVE